MSVKGEVRSYFIVARRVVRHEIVLCCIDNAGLEPLGDGSECLVTLREGKYHQVKRMLAARGKPVRYLKRLSMGPIRLDPALGPGEWRPLTREEVAALRRGQ